ncbi:hypothetical protein Tco_1202824 [Tanacetum coccineum]
MVGSSNGLACINSFDGDEIIVANPWTREERMLQKLTVSPVRSCWGFGYDALTDDYKVVFEAVEDWYLCNGALHWVMYYGSPSNQRLISLDLSKKTQVGFSKALYIHPFYRYVEPHISLSSRRQ